MTKSIDVDIVNLVEFEEQAQRQKRVMAQLLDMEIARKDQTVVLKGEMGHINFGGTTQLIPSFTAVHTLGWVGMFIKMGSDMPLMQAKIDVDGRLIVDNENADELQQRAPDWTRQAALTSYLIHSKFRKFSTILAVVSPSWVDDPKHEYWGKDGRALKSAIFFRSLDSAGRIGVIDLNENQIYALDGQHRVMGIRGIKELQDGRLTLKKKNGSPINKSYSRDEFLDEFHSDITHLQRVMNEKITVEYIPSVLPGETRKEAAQRVRSVFVAINKYAKNIDKGEGILLNEADGYSIIARSIGIHHPLFKSTKGSRVNFKNTSLPKKSLWYTTLQALRDATEKYVYEINPEMASDWAPKFDGQVPIRPDEKELEYAREKIFELFNYIRNLPVFNGLESGDDLTTIRSFPNEVDGGRGHLLVRPIGITILAKAVGRVLSTKGMSLDEIFNKLVKFDKQDGFEAHRPQSIWWGVTYNPSKDTMNTNTSNQEFAVKLLVYMLAGAEASVRDELRDELLSKYRRGDEGGVKNFDGQWVENDGDFDLPLPIK